MRERLTKMRDDSALEVAATLRTGEVHNAIVKAGFVSGIEAAHDLINDIIADANKTGS